jgi:hypothetical protein
LQTAAPVRGTKRPGQTALVEPVGPVAAEQERGLCPVTGAVLLLLARRLSRPQGAVRAPSA